MKKVMKQSILFILVLALCCVAVKPYSSQAATKDVTAKMKNNKNVKALTKRVGEYMVCVAAGKHTKKTVTIKNSNKNRLSIASYVRYNFNNDYAFTKSEIDSTVKNLFGKKISKYQNVTFFGKANGSINITTPYMYTGGDWGDYSPVVKIVNVKKSGNTYVVKATGKLSCYWDFSTKTKKICTMTIKLKKKSISKYGYVVTGMKYKGTGIGYF